MIHFFNTLTGDAVHPDDYTGERPHIGDIMTTADTVFTVAAVEDEKNGDRIVSLHPDRPRVDTKDTNPKDAIGISKAPVSVVPLPFINAVGLAMMEGALKYGRHNYRPAGIRYSVYFDAAMRHLFAWWEGEDIDADSGLPHPVKAAACMAVLFDAMVQENGTDDRPPSSPPGWLAGMNKHAKALLEKYPNPVPPHTEK